MATSQETVTTRQGMSSEEIRAMVAKQIQDGQAQVKLEQLYEDNFKLRGKNEKLTTELETTKTKVPKAEDLVLSGDDIALFNEVKATGKNLKQLKELVKEHASLSTEVTSLKRKTVISDIAEAENWKPAVLERLTTGMNLLGVEETQEEVDDETSKDKKKKVQVKRGFLNVTDDKGVVTGKKKLVEELADFLPSLSKTEVDNKEGTTGGKGTGTPMPRMSRGDTAAPGDKGSVSKDLIKRRYSMPGRDKDKK